MVIWKCRKYKSTLVNAGVNVSLFSFDKVKCISVEQKEIKSEVKYVEETYECIN